MPSLTKVKYYNSLPIRYRVGTTDENIIKEVLETRCYRRPTYGFDVEHGELWLDLGANIGAFAVYCIAKGAKVTCFEPDPACFALLEKNAAKAVNCYNSAVTASREERIPFNVSRTKANHARGSVLSAGGLKPSGTVANTHLGDWADGMAWDGIKIDIEGAEFGIIDGDLLPDCNKLVLEYHTSRDRSAKNLGKRLNKLRERFDHVAYPAELDRLVKAGGSARTFFDRSIFCWND